MQFFFSLILGGPLVRERNGTLIGVVHAVSIEKNDDMIHITLSKYMKIDYYFNWISNVTGISLPDCGPSPPSPNSEDVETLRFHLHMEQMLGRASSL